MDFIKHVGRFTLASIVAAGLHGCGGSTPIIDDRPTTDIEQAAAVDIDALLNQAQMSRSPQKEQLLLQAAQHLSLQGEQHWARNLLNSIDPTLLDDEQFIAYTLTFSEIALADDAFFLAQRILTNPRLDQQWQTLAVEQQVLLRQRRADLFMVLGEPNASIEELLALQPLINDPLLDIDNQDVLWQALMSMPVAELTYRSQKAANTPTLQNEDLRGWYSLALISKNNQGNLDKQLFQINQWVARWPQHPASLRLPKDLQLLQQLIEERPAQVAVLLPQQGRLAKAGKAVRDGFVAAYYQALANGSHTPVLKFYDTSEGDIVDVYNRASLDGADLMIGPLDKNKVTTLSQQESLPIPTLAVNYSEDVAEPATNLFQFGLSAEDEARQIARRAWVEGHRYAMILTTDANWGRRSADAFRQAWENLGGTIITQSEFTGEGDFSNVIKQALHINESQKRAQGVRALFPQPVEFEPRRRQDADMLFMVARPTEARQIKPTLAFHYASKLPVYATSHIYSGTEDRKADRDLNNIRFSTLPWFFDNNNATKQVIQQAANPAPSYQRLYALGVDSFQLYPRLKQLQQSEYTRLYGVTGSLSMNAQRRVEREQIWAKMNNGRAQSLPMVVSHN
ncbi:MAG: penicillin-binding protein activator [Cellvibrionaceae bacterium]|nr:penicillin-binding protein activator [Cellvibrionaceae bacterium]